MEKLISGTIATIFTVSMKIPQIYHAIKTKKTHDLSMMFLIMSFLNHIAWLIYAFFDDFNIPLIICDSISILLNILLISLKKY